MPSRASLASKGQRRRLDVDASLIDFDNNVSPSSSGSRPPREGGSRPMRFTPRTGAGNAAAGGRAPGQRGPRQGPPSLRAQGGPRGPRATGGPGGPRRRPPGGGRSGDAGDASLQAARGIWEGAPLPAAPSDLSYNSLFGPVSVLDGHLRVDWRKGVKAPWADGMTLDEGQCGVFPLKRDAYPQREGSRLCERQETSRLWNHLPRGLSRATLPARISAGISSGGCPSTETSRTSTMCSCRRPSRWSPRQWRKSVACICRDLIIIVTRACVAYRLVSSSRLLNVHLVFFSPRSGRRPHHRGCSRLNGNCPAGLPSPPAPPYLSERCRSPLPLPPQRTARSAQARRIDPPWEWDWPVVA